MARARSLRDLAWVAGIEFKDPLAFVTYWPRDLKQVPPGAPLGANWLKLARRYAEDAIKDAHSSILQTFERTQCGGDCTKPCSNCDDIRFQQAIIDVTRLELSVLKNGQEMYENACDEYERETRNLEMHLANNVFYDLPLCTSTGYVSYEAKIAVAYLDEFCDPIDRMHSSVGCFDRESRVVQMLIPMILNTGEVIKPPFMVRASTPPPKNPLLPPQ